MGVAMNAHELARSMHAAKKEIDDAFVTYETCIREDAEADDAARRAKARSYIACREQIGPKATVAHVEAAVDLETADTQKAARLAEGRKRAAGMAVDAKKQWLSALQSLASLTRAEAQLAKWEPSETAGV